MNENEVLRDLPAGYDDESSPYWLKPEHRDDFQVVAITDKELNSYLDARRSAEDKAEDLALWERTRALKEARLDPSSYNRWLRENSKADGSPNLLTVSGMGDVKFRGMNHSRRLSPDATRLAEFHAVRAAAEARAEGQKLARRNQIREELEQTCRICRTSHVAISPIDAPAGRPVRTCAKCRQLLELMQVAQELVPAGGDRAESISRWLSADSTTAPRDPEPSDAKPAGLLASLGFRRS